MSMTSGQPAPPGGQASPYPAELLFHPRSDTPSDHTHAVTRPPTIPTLRKHNLCTLRNHTPRTRGELLVDLGMARDWSRFAHPKSPSGRIGEQTGGL